MDYAKYSIPIEDSSPSFTEYEDDEEDTFVMCEHNEEGDQIEFDKYISSKVRLMEDDTEQIGVIRGRKRGPDGTFIGKFDVNLILDTSVYEIEFEDGRVESYFANQIVECILDDREVNANLTHHINDFVDHRKDSKALSNTEDYLTIRGTKVPKRTTKGWHLCAELSNGKTEWMRLNIAKDASPIKAARYAVANKIADEPAFRWWVPYVLEKEERVIKAVKCRVPKPNDVERALQIDDETGTTHWSTALAKGTKTVLPALKILEQNEKIPPVYKYIDLLTIFDVKMDLTRKVRICARGDQIDTSPDVTYASVVTRESIRIGFVLASLNDVNILTVDVAGAYLNASCAEKVYTI